MARHACGGVTLPEDRIVSATHSQDVTRKMGVMAEIFKVPLDCIGVEDRDGYKAIGLNAKGRALRLAREEIEEFFCEGCRLWLRTGGIVHDADEHEGAPRTQRYRYSYDGGTTWQDEPRGVPSS